MDGGPQTYLMEERRRPFVRFKTRRYAALKHRSEENPMSPVLQHEFDRRRDGRIGLRSERTSS
jgi:hypothetical protein